MGSCGKRMAAGRLMIMILRVSFAQLYDNSGKRQLQTKLGTIKMKRRAVVNDLGHLKI